MPCNNNGKNKVILHLKGDITARFVSRNNRFLGTVEISGKKEVAHIHDPGRLEELLYSGNRVLLKRYNNPRRKTKWEIIGAEFQHHWIFINSKFHRAISQRIIEDPEISPFGNIDKIIPEIKAGNSRLDYLIEKGGKRIWVEVKGCTLLKNGISLFPDAPTRRGTRHVEELIKKIDSGDRGALMILVFHHSKCFLPNAQTDPHFARFFWEGVEMGLEIYPVELNYDGEIITYAGPVKICKG